MIANPTEPAWRIRDRLAGQHILLTGSTGFLAKAFLEKLLRSIDTIGGVYLLVRPRPGGKSAEQRVMRDVLGSRAFDRLRATLGDGFQTRCDEIVHIVAGDLTKQRLGLSPDEYGELSRRITLVVNSAATVTFDERLDLAVELNTLGPSRLLTFAQDAGSIPFLHVSTCYVCGARTGTMVEDMSAPEVARERLPRHPQTGQFDLDRLTDSLRAEAAATCDRLGSETDACRRELIDLGMSKSRSFGWNDTYTFTKWIGEQRLKRDHGDVPLAIFRPAIIESSYQEPMPGWIDGLRMADPLIVAYGRGKLTEFPANPSIPLDLIPVDFVANAMIATLPLGDEWRGRLAVYQCASSDRHPVLLREISRGLERAFALRPMIADDGKPLRLGPFRLVDQRKFLSRYERRQRWVSGLRRLLERAHIARKSVRKLAGISRQIDQLIYFAKIYSPYTHLDCRFADDELRAIEEALHPDDRAAFPFAVDAVDWNDYIVNRHVPGMRLFVLGTGSEPSPRIIAVDQLGRVDGRAGTEALKADNLFEVFRRSAERFPGKYALQIRREKIWLRYTYDEALRATGTIMRRFRERGLSPGDRVAICGENGPEWALTYLAAMRAGLTAVPLDPQLPAGDAWAAARFVDARLICAGATTVESLIRGRDEGDAEVVAMRDPFVPPPAASRDPVPAPAPVSDSDVASILFTSGTTVAPKAVQLTHRNFIANAIAMLKVHPVDPTDELLSVLPLYHSFEFTAGFIVPLASGATITYVDQLKGPQIRAAMQATGTTIMLVVPRLVRMFHDAIEAQLAVSGIVTRAAARVLGWLSDLTGGRYGRYLFRRVHKAFGGRLRMLVCGGSRLDPELFESFQRMGLPVYEGYGLTETAPVLSVNPAGAAKAGSVGPMLSNVDVEIRHQNLEGIGEVWVRGPNVMSGYLKNPEATREILVDGWLRTGDLGRLDEDNYLYLTGRSKDLIVTAAGKNVYPDEVEMRYRDLPYVKELCVLGMASADGLGDSVHAVVVVDTESAPELDPSSMEREIRLAAETISESLPSHERIAVMHFWDRELPKTSTLKAKRTLIADMLAAEATARDDTVGATSGLHGSDADETAGAGPIDPPPATLAAVRAIVARQTRRAPDDIQNHMHLLLDLGIDSIGKIDVLGSVETQFGMRIDDDKAAKVARVVDLIRLVGDREPKTATVPARSVWQRKMADAPSANAANGHLPFPLMPVRWLIRGGVAVFMNTYVRVHARGREHIPKKGAFILAPNHASHLDTPSVLTAVSGLRRVWVAGAEDYFFNTAVKRFLFGRVLDTIAFDRQADGVRGLRRCGEALARGDGLLIFPEGTRSVTGALQPFKIGVSVLALERGVPVVPVHIHRTYDLLRKGQRIVRPGAATVTFGKPIYPPTVDDQTDHYAVFRSLTERIEQAVSDMVREASA